MTRNYNDVLIAVPNRGAPSPAGFHSVIGALYRAEGSQIVFSAAAPRDFNRNFLCRQFLDNKQFQWMLFVDDDTIVPNDIISLLIEVDKPVVVGVQPLFFRKMMVVNISYEIQPPGEKMEWPNWVAWEFRQPPHPIKCCGFGCVLIHRDVLERIGHPWFVENYGDVYGENAVTEDIDFCRKCDERGIEMWVCPSAICGHVKSIDLRTVLPLTMIAMPAEFSLIGGKEEMRKHMKGDAPTG